MPTLFHKFDPAIHNSSWPCDPAVGTLLLIWWEFQVLQLFWYERHSVISQVTIYTLDYSPAFKAYFTSLAMNMVDAAKMCIPIHWGSAHAFSFPKCFTHVNKVA